MNRLLTFELRKDEDSLEIHLNKEGLDRFINMLQTLQNERDHIILMTKEWGGSSLTSEKQGNSNELLNKIKIFRWEDKN